MQPSDDDIRAMLAGATRSAEAMRTTDGWSIVAPYMCINGLSALFTLARVSDPDDAEVGYTDGALDAETARANAALYAAAPDLAALALSRGEALSKAEAENARLTDVTIDLASSLAAAISLLERGGKAAKKAAPSDKMFDQMIADYRASLRRARAALGGDDA